TRWGATRSDEVCLRAGGCAPSREPVVEARHARVVDGAPAGNDLQRLPRRRRRANQLEEAAFGRIVEVEIGEKEMLVGVAGEQLLLRRIAVEEAFPESDPLR